MEAIGRDRAGGYCSDSERRKIDQGLESRTGNTSAFELQSWNGSDSSVSVLHHLMLSGYKSLSDDSRPTL